MGKSYIVLDGERITLGSFDLNWILNEAPDAESIKRFLGQRLCKECKPARDMNECLRDTDFMKIVKHNTSKKPKTKIFIEVGSDTVPSEYTVKVLLRLFENYCNHFHKAPYAKIENGKIKFYFEGVNKR